MDGDTLTIAFKNANGVTADEYLHDLDPDTSILELKQMLSNCYPGQPHPTAQRVVFAGRYCSHAVCVRVP
jgi:hypothetical protein